MVRSNSWEESRRLPKLRVGPEFPLRVGGASADDVRVEHPVGALLIGEVKADIGVSGRRKSVLGAAKPALAEMRTRLIPLEQFPALDFDHLAADFYGPAGTGGAGQPGHLALASESVERFGASAGACALGGSGCAVGGQDSNSDASPAPG